LEITIAAAWPVLATFRPLMPLLLVTLKSFAFSAWILTLALRKNQAQVRYWVWFVASVKFLVPFSLLVGLGAKGELTRKSWRRAVTASIGAATRTRCASLGLALPRPATKAAVPTKGIGPPAASRPIRW